ncbi:glycoside hydrolase family 88/105 protein [Hymenobacter metallicola]|uniref:Glycoside hydrolase family 88 protein n=1 Tax=Hymenobacter metallicola TaxID=2563114 RepID=A0A4Z0QG55_9BACT|nr:glycoside hydrolase family 88 protein [Hymenobacter metallicola]TGE29007.1 glycoside hydrolase family 88 protein [Hymenobacter metallicola]
MKLPSLLTHSLAGLSFLGLVLTAAPAPAQKLPKKQKVLRAMTLTNDYFMQKWPDPGKDIMTNKPRPSHIWTRSVYYEGLLALHQIDKQKRYYDYAVDWAEKHQWGIRNGVTDRDADNQCAGQTYIELYQIDRKPERIRDIKACIDHMVNSPKVDDWSWIDALQMAMPVYAKLGAEYNDSRYFEKMYQLYNHSKTQQGGKGLYNPQDGLWWRDKDFVPPYKEPNGEDCYWSRGNGWVVAAMVRVLDVLPRSAPHRDEYVQMYMQMMKVLPAQQRPDGFWNVSLHDANHYGGKELTGTALFVYGMAWGINRGLLDRKQYQPIIAKAWQAMIKDALHPDGFLGYVQGTGKEPKDGQPVSYTSKPDFEDYGLGCFLLAGSEVYKLQP